MIRSRIAWQVTALCLAATASASGQERAKIEPVGVFEEAGIYWGSEATAVSGDGKHVVGVASVANGQRAFVWSAETGAVSLGALGDDHYSVAEGVSDDGKVVVGWSQGEGRTRAFRWTRSGGVASLGTIEGASGDSAALGVSGDGNFVVGVAASPGGAEWPYSSAFRWTPRDGMQDMGVFGNPDSSQPGRGLAEAISSNGAVIVGNAATDDPDYSHYSFRSVNDGGLQSLGPHCIPLAVSATGVFIAGNFSRPESPHSVAGIHSGGAWRSLGTIDDVVGYSSAADVSADGRVVIGVSQISDVDSDVAPCIWVDGQGSWLEDFLEEEYELDLIQSGWSTLTDVAACSDDGKTIVGTGFYNGADTAFRITLFQNAPPTIAPVAPNIVECVDQEHWVDVDTVVADVDGDKLTVTWKLNGVVEDVYPDWDAGPIGYGFDLPHGTHVVTIEASDGYVTTATEVTITVQDTIAPTIVIAGDVVVPTDPGKAVATNVVLPTPTTSDLSGHPVTVTNDAPATYPLGTTVVTWTVTDAEGHVTRATQKVIVVDREKPKILPLPPIARFCDSGRLFATIKLSPPKTTDNVAEPVRVTTKARSPFLVGVTNVVWTATDAAGNQSQWTQKVTVGNRRPKAKAGKDVTVYTKSERGAAVTLDGSASTDPDKHSLTFEWAAKGVKFTRPKKAKTSGFFRVGTTTVKLTVTDAAGAERSDTVKVTVRLKNAKRRSSGADANAAFAAATKAAQASAARGTVTEASASGLAYASVAAGYGDAAGEFVRWEEGQSEADALFTYSELRLIQRQYGGDAAAALLAAYAETGDESLRTAYSYAVYGTAAAQADLAE